MTVPAFRARKGQEPLVMLTAYTARMAELLDPCCDALLVGDSLAQTIYGLPSTVPVTLDTMIAHGAAVGARAHRAGGGGHAFRQLRSQSRAGLRVGLPRAEGNRRGRHQAGRRRGHGRHGRLPVGARHPRDGTCGPDAAGGEHPGRLRRARTRPCRAGQDRGRRRSHRRRRRLRGGGRGRGGTAGGIDRRQPVLPRDRHRRVRVMRRTGAGGRRHAGHVRAHRPFREALRHTVRTHPGRGADLFRGSEGPALPGPEHLYEAPKA